MHPSIAKIPNALIYKGRLIDKSNRSDDQISDWYDTNWKYDAPVILIDTGPLNAWVTSVPRGKGSSRLNFLSATLCIELCQRLLKNVKSEPAEEKTHRIIIECPYRPHADLLNIMVSEYGLKQVGVGTIHTFQGSESDVVIFDLVNDEPHWKVAVFDPKNDENTKRLINVALTRARHRLIIVGDFSYIEDMSKRSFLGRDFIPFIRDHYPVHSALEVIPTSIISRAAEASDLVSISKIDRSAAQTIVTQDDFYPILKKDLRYAKKRIVIYSPFITQDRITDLQVSLRAVVERGVQIFVVTKTLDERGKRSLENYKFLEKTLEDWQVVIIHKKNMHEKLVIIDDKILWSGSLNPLSFSDTQEIMERRLSKKIVEKYLGIIQFKNLVDEFSDGKSQCPICGSEMIASEGLNEPYYWRCVVDGCYSRNIDQPQIKGGIITCSNCGGEVEYSKHGGKPVWRCTVNKRHHQRLARTHIRLPEMKIRIPLDELRALEGLFKNGNKTVQEVLPLLDESQK